MYEDYPEEYEEELEKRKPPIVKLAERVLTELAVELPPVLRSESTTEEYLEYLNKKREACEALLEKKHRERMEGEYNRYLEARERFQKTRENLKNAITDFLNASSRPLHRDCLFICDDEAKNYTFLVRGDFPGDVVNKLLSKNEHVFCVQDQEERLEYLLVSNNGEICRLVALPPEEPIKYEDLKRFVLVFIDGEIIRTKNQAERDKKFEKLVDTIIDDGAYQRLRNDNQRIFYLTHKYDLLRRDARYIMDLLAAMRVMEHK